MPINPLEKPKAAREKIEKTGRPQISGKPMSMDERQNNLTQMEENERRDRERELYGANLLIGNISLQEVQNRVVVDDFEMRKNPKMLTSRYLPFINASEKSSAESREKKGHFPAAGEKQLDKNLEDAALANKIELFILITGKSVSPESDEFKKFDQQLTLLLPQNYAALPREKQLSIAEKLRSDFRFSSNAKLFRKYLLRYQYREGVIGNIKAFSDDKNAVNGYLTKVQNGEDPESAFNKVIQESPELKARFESYEKTWKSKQVADFFKEKIEIPGVKLEVPTQNQVDKVVSSYSKTDIQLDIPHGGHGGLLRSGEIVREVDIYIADGKPVLFVHDNNADRGVRGPIAPENLEKTVVEISVDDYFSRKFREMSSVYTETDPTKLADSKLMDYVHAFTTDVEKQGGRFEKPEKILLENLAQLFVDPSIDIFEKNKFFEQILKNPLQRLKVQQILKKEKWGDFSKKDWGSFRQMLQTHQLEI